MITVEVNNNKIHLTGNLRVLNKVFEDMKVKHPNAYYIRSYMEPGWDGKLKYLTEQGYSKTGLLPLVTSLLEKYNEEFTIVDTRKALEVGQIPDKINTFIPRPHQIEAVESIIYNKVHGTPFQRGIINAAVNAGKTLIAAMIHLSFKNVKTLILVNNSPLFEQFLKDMPVMFGDNWGYMQGKKVKWADIMVCMTPTLRNNLDLYHQKLSQYNACIFDECHLITSKTNKKVLTFLYNTVIRVGLSGTPFGHKDPTKNMDVRAFFGDETYKITSLELMDQGYSTNLVIKMQTGNTQVRIPGDYDEEYNHGITESREREHASLERIRFYLKRGCYPILVTCRYHKHVERLFGVINNEFGRDYKIGYLHGKVKERKEILQDFKDGRIDILVASLLIKLGQNMPLIRYMQNAAGGDSEITALQLIGRAIRKHKSKSKVYYEDFADMGVYLSRHSKHRFRYYKKEGYKVILANNTVRKILRVKTKK